MRAIILMLALLAIPCAKADDAQPAPEKSKVVKAKTPATLAAGGAEATPLPQDTQAAAQSAVVRQKHKPATNLPGVGKLSGDPAVFNASVIHVSSNRNEVAYVSRGYANRFSTPFRHPMLVGTVPDKYSDENIKVVGSSMYFPPIDESFAIFMTGDDPGDQVISLTLVPKVIPAQTLKLMLDDRSSPAERDRKEGIPGSYTEALIEKFRMVAIGKVPQGFSSAKMPPTIARAGTLVVIPEERFSGQKLDIYRYRVENADKDTVELSEPSFYEKGVRGVAIYPNLKLNAGEFTYVLVAADKGTPDAGLAATGE